MKLLIEILVMMSLLWAISGELELDDRLKARLRMLCWVVMFLAMAIWTLSKIRA